jgi:hypothetical protein
MSGESLKPPQLIPVIGMVKLARSLKWIVQTRWLFATVQFVMIAWLAIGLSSANELVRGLTGPILWLVEVPLWATLISVRAGRATAVGHSRSPESTTEAGLFSARVSRPVRRRSFWSAGSTTMGRALAMFLRSRSRGTDDDWILIEAGAPCRIGAFRYSTDTVDGLRVS